jgi:hypothetical protein
MMSLATTGGALWAQDKGMGCTDMAAADLASHGQLGKTQSLQAGRIKEILIIHTA